MAVHNRMLKDLGMPEAKTYLAVSGPKTQQQRMSTRTAAVNNTAVRDRDKSASLTYGA
jgi:hypothetical protein